jgi:hypothetical protein
MEIEEIQMHPQTKLVFDFLIDNGYHKSKTLCAVGFALNHPMTTLMSLQDAADSLHCTRQAISKLKCAFQRHCGIAVDSKTGKK